MLRNLRTGPLRPVRILSALAAAAAAAGTVPYSASPAAAQTYASRLTADGQSIADFYRARSNRTLWFAQPGRQVDALLQLLSTARLDGLDPNRYQLEPLARELSLARSGKRGAMKRAEQMLSQALVSYVRDLRTPKDVGTIYVDAQLRPNPPSPRAILDAAARAPSLERWIADMRWMNPMYRDLRAALASSSFDGAQRNRIRLNLDRARELPAGTGKYVLVNAAAQRLFMYENGQVVDSMRVVVGKPIYPTPMMAALIRFANLNPYWYVPADLAAERIAPNAVKQGIKYLDRQGYQVVSDFVSNPRIIDPSQVDWKAVANGTHKIAIRQLPGPHNSMGRIKFMFPNSEGVYLHDNPERELFEEASRLYSGGCVRLEAAWRLSRWLFGRDLTWEGAGTEEQVPLATPVPVYITYLTAVPEGSQVAFLDDVYGRDKARLAEVGRDNFASR